MSSFIDFYLILRTWNSSKSIWPAGPGDSPAAPIPALVVQAFVAKPGLYVGSEDLNSGCHASTENTTH